MLLTRTRWILVLGPLLLLDGDLAGLAWKKTTAYHLERAAKSCGGRLVVPAAAAAAGGAAGRAELLLRPELLLQALSEAVPRKMDWWRERDRKEEQN
ncbi:hypothetical protein FJT64_021707 [Amphibalanus amphitrite]|uniref:Secreted protein n=1 Tax=Amphibalanus amphitrite TaxID=1232801 RepID=A0A6A4WJ76_AMPAM|nr:hypothetical protein FJT64_021707 [Amphibalanus amphitrite]